MAEFVFVSGRLCLDLAGTQLWRRSLRTELLNSPEDLRLWVRQADLLDDPGTMDARALDRVCRLREAVYTLVRAWSPGNPPDTGARDALAEVNEAARLPLPKHQLDETGRLTRTGSTDEILGAIARDAVDLLSSDQFPRMRECANADCTRLFVDLSRSGARRWCGMAECGNRNKAASYRKRKKQQAVAETGT
ncbi:CGNR zinc finger domain-containing protein [Streptomyces cylindrosporus]|uniref:ABATE domain-containing protein n=1 Tax=Streptomyces cylindrosporus TaxID=2927583 RepID=A0ABS9YKK8_9ACTN|nr:ABATE domain-containing protein [Streptomyces cylindrosporus]MCI3277797.1 ABATE domain-containing protein [Streptomyces cylindrosporus]